MQMETFIMFPGVPSFGCVALNPFSQPDDCARPLIPMAVRPSFCFSFEAENGLGTPHIQRNGRSQGNFWTLQLHLR